MLTPAAGRYAMFDLSDLPVVDNHVHPWRATTRHLTADQLAGEVAFSQTALTSVRQPFLPRQELEPKLKLFHDTNLVARYLLRELSSFLGVAEEWPAVAAARNAAAEADYRAWTARLFADVRLDTLCVDEGGAQPRITLAELGQTVPV